MCNLLTVLWLWGGGLCCVQWAPPSAVTLLLRAACLQVSRTCNTVMESDGEHAQHLPVGSQDLAANTLKGQGQRGHGCPPGDLSGTTTGLNHPGLWLLTTDESLCLFTPSDNLPPRCVVIQCGFATLAIFGLTFLVSLRLISLFSSISSCSLRAAENDRRRVMLRV